MIRPLFIIFFGLFMFACSDNQTVHQPDANKTKITKSQEERKKLALEEKLKQEQEKTRLAQEKTRLAQEKLEQSKKDLERTKKEGQKNIQESADKLTETIIKSEKKRQDMKNQSISDIIKLLGDLNMIDKSKKDSAYNTFKANSAPHDVVSKYFEKNLSPTKAELDALDLNDILTIYGQFALIGAQAQIIN